MDKSIVKMILSVFIFFLVIESSSASVCSKSFLSAICNVAQEDYQNAHVAPGQLFAEDCTRFCESVGVTLDPDMGNETECCSFVILEGAEESERGRKGYCTAFHKASRPLIRQANAIRTGPKAANCVKQGGQKQPHILMIVLDDAGHNDYDWSPGNAFETPVMRQLITDGIPLGQHYTQQVCAPSRFSLNTGRHSAGLGMQTNNIKPDHGVALSLENPLLSEELRERGYSTYGFGKWHLGHSKKEFTPTYRGFDSFYGRLVGSGDHWTHTKGIAKIGDQGFKYYCEAIDLRSCEGSNVVTDYDKNGTHSTPLYTTEVIEKIKSHDSRKSAFFYIAYNAPHTPYQAEQEFVRQFRDVYPKHKDTLELHPRAIVAGMMKGVDVGIRRIIKALKSAEMWSDTITVIMSDNGASRLEARQESDRTASGGYHTSNWPLRGGKGTTFEGGTRNTAILHTVKHADRHDKYPRRWSPIADSLAGRSYNELFFITDWLPTLLEATGRPVQRLQFDDFDGVSHWKKLTSDPNSESPRTEILLSVAQCGESICGGLRIGNMKYVKVRNRTKEKYFDYVLPDTSIKQVDTPFEPVDCGIHPAQVNGNSISNKQMADTAKGISHCLEDSPCLFNIAEDPCELNDLSSQMPRVLEAMEQRLVAYGEKMPRPKNELVSEGCNAVSFFGEWGLWLDNPVDTAKYRELESINAEYTWQNMLNKQSFYLWNVSEQTCFDTCSSTKSCRGLFFYTRVATPHILECAGITSYEGTGGECQYRSCKSFTKVRWDTGSCKVPGSACQWKSQCCGRVCEKGVCKVNAESETQAPTAAPILLDCRDLEMRYLKFPESKPNTKWFVKAGSIKETSRSGCMARCRKKEACVMFAYNRKSNKCDIRRVRKKQKDSYYGISIQSSEFIRTSTAWTTYFVRNECLNMTVKIESK